MSLLKSNYIELKSKKPKPLIMGIDPGFTGAVSVLDIETEKLVDIIKMPLFKTKSTVRVSGEQNNIDVHALAFALDIYSNDTAVAILEEPGAMPNQGLSSTFKFGHSCGLIHGVCAGLLIPVIPIKPAVWKMGLGIPANKKEAKKRADSLYPADRGLWYLAKSDGLFESLLLAHYGLKKLTKIVESFRI